MFPTVYDNEKLINSDKLKWDYIKYLMKVLFKDLIIWKLKLDFI